MLFQKYFKVPGTSIPPRENCNDPTVAASCEESETVQIRAVDKSHNP